MSAPAQDAVLRIGEVIGVEGRRISVLVDKAKNLSHMFLGGEIITNIAVNSYLEIRKGFLRIIGRVEGERIEDDFRVDAEGGRQPTNRSLRILTVGLTGYIDERGRFTGGTRELPLVGNEAFLLGRDQLRRVHDLVHDSELSISIATVHGDDLSIRFPVDGLFNSHIAIFGNTGSGKSNTLAHLYQELVNVLTARNQARYEHSTRFVLFDFNGEYAKQDCITTTKAVYNLSTRRQDGDRLPMPQGGLLDIEVLSILADASEKTQKPFLKRALDLLSRIRSANAPREYYRGILRRHADATLQMADKVRAFQLLDYFRQVLPAANAAGEAVNISGDIDWHGKANQFVLRQGPIYLQQEPNRIPETNLYRQCEVSEFGDDLLGDVVRSLYVQLMSDLINQRAQNEHVAPVINRLVRKHDDIQKLFALNGDQPFWRSNFVVVNLHDVNLEMRKTIPLLLSKRLYADQKRAPTDRTLTIIIDEAHNILSTESFREAESWKDYRLETFEEIIKEGRKFGVFVTIASQRPNDISPTITSQAHNYFIHRLINDRDLKTIASAVSYIDKVTEESIPTLATGTCVFSGVVTSVPLKIDVRALPHERRPESATRTFTQAVPVAGGEFVLDEGPLPAL